MSVAVRDAITNALRGELRRVLRPAHRSHAATSGYVQILGRLDDGLSTRTHGRRPRSAKARNRGMWSAGGAACPMGIWFGLRVRVEWAAIVVGHVFLMPLRA